MGQSSWALACRLVTSVRPPHDEAIREVETELATGRGKSAREIEEMRALVRWAVNVLNPLDGRTLESGGTVYQLVADYDDVEWAVEIAEEREGLPAEKAASLRALIRRHLD